MAIKAWWPNSWRVKTVLTGPVAKFGHEDFPMSRAFGRRPVPKTPPPLVAKFSRPAATASQAETSAPSVDEELRAWKKSRGSAFPVKLLALTASLSFGIASVALPKEINEVVQYPLYALSGLSLYLGFRRKRRQS